MISTRYDPSIPPLNSLTIPNSFGSSRSIKREWRMYWVRKRIAGKVKRLVFLGNDGLSLFKKFALSKGLRYKEIFDFKGSFFPGVKEIREIVISPKELDFPKRLESINQIYFGMPSNFKRFDPMLGESCEELIEELNRIKTEHSHFVIYCSLGSIPDQHSLRYLYFFRKVVESLSQRDDFFIILAVGRLSHTFFDVPRNVRILNYAPQQEILNYTNVFITHGGLNSVLESLNAGVPMIIYPLNNTWDQNGNAARIFYHGFGLIGDIEADSEKDILRNVYKIVNDKSFKDNINKFNSVVRNNHIKSIETIS